MQIPRHFITQCFRLLLVLTNLALIWPFLGCSPAVVHVASADGRVFEQWLHDGMASDARRPAHLMQAYVRGDLPGKAEILHDERLPEPYHVETGSSIQPSDYHLISAATWCSILATCQRVRCLKSFRQDKRIKTREKSRLAFAADQHRKPITDFSRPDPLELH